MPATTPKDHDGPETHAERLFSMLRTWGLAEATLDMVLVAIMRDHDTRQPRPPYPATLEHKLKYLAEAVAMFPTLEAGSDWAAKANAKFKTEKTLRNSIVHGTPLKHEKNGTVHFMCLERQKGRVPHYVVKVVRPKDWDRLFEASVAAFTYLSLLLFLVAPPEDELLNETEEGLRKRDIQFAAQFPGSKELRKLMHEVLSGGA